MPLRPVSTGRALAVAAEALVILLVVLTVAVALGPAGWLGGLAYTVIGWAVLAEGIRRFEVRSFAPRGRLVLARAVLVGGVTALVVETTDPRPDPDVAIVVLSALVLVVGAIRAGEPDEFESRFAMAVGSFFVLVLSALAAVSAGWWVLAIGGLRYAFVLAGRFLPWLRADLPDRRSRGVVAAGQGIALTAAVAVPHPVTTVLAAAALAALCWSFGADVWWLHRNRTPVEARPRGGRITGWVLTGLSALLVLVALVGPNRLGQLNPGAFARIPVEGLMLAGLVLVLPGRARRIAVVVTGAALGLLTIVKMIDMGFYEVFDRPFHPVFDWSFFGPALDFVDTSVGGFGAALAVVGVVLLAVGLLVVMVLAVRRLTRVAVGHRTGASNVLATLGVLWLVGALAGLPLASRSAADHLHDSALQVRQGLLDGRQFADEAAVDAYRYTPGRDLLTGLRGKDVLVVFVESYGRVAIENSSSAPKIDPLLDASTTRLRSAGFDSRSAFLTSPVSGGGSWLAHATLQTGLWIDNPQRRTSLATLDRMTLSIAFNRAGWRTVGVVPANTEDWPDGDIYHFDKVYDSRNVGYRGPRFSYATVPDQYTLQHFEQTERSRDTPVMAEIDLVSSHTPFTPVPSMVGWDDIGDGSVYDPMPAKGPQPGDVWPDPTKVRNAYTASIEYALKSLFGYIEKYGDDNLVVLFLGDHQPQPVISEQQGSRDVPVTIVARDPAVLRDIDSWGWQPGLNPSPAAPVWRMDTFRDRFLRAYGPAPGTARQAGHRPGAPR